jgi:hypothetical protein
MSSDSNAHHNSSEKKLTSPAHSAVDKGTTMRVRKFIGAAVNRLRFATGTAPFALTATSRFFGLNAGDWSMILVGLVLSGLVLTLI